MSALARLPARQARDYMRVCGFRAVCVSARSGSWRVPGRAENYAHACAFIGSESSACARVCVLGVPVRTRAKHACACAFALASRMRKRVRPLLGVRLNARIITRMHAHLSVPSRLFVHVCVPCSPARTCVKDAYACAFVPPSRVRRRVHSLQGARLDAHEITRMHAHSYVQGRWYTHVCVLCILARTRVQHAYACAFAVQSGPSAFAASSVVYTYCTCVIYI